LPDPMEAGNKEMLAMFNGLVTVAMGMVGAWARQRYFPYASAAPPAQQNVSRPEMLHLLFGLQSQLEAQKQHRAFLSVDVVGAETAGAALIELGALAALPESSYGQPAFSWQAGQNTTNPS